MPWQDIQCVVFDFAFTLCSELYFKSLRPRWGHVITEALFGPSPNLSDEWMAGRLSSADIARHLATLIPETADDILNSLDEGCCCMSFNPAVWDFALAQRAAGRRTALVTLNMDVFSRVIVPAHGLAEVFDVIVCSADHGELDKERLFEVAFRQLGPEFGFGNSLLVDDSERNIQVFRRHGGMGHRYTDDVMFRRWLAEECQ